MSRKSCEKMNLVLINKADYLSEKQRQYWAEYFDSINVPIAFFSALEENTNHLLHLLKIEEEGEQVVEAEKDQVDEKDDALDEVDEEDDFFDEVDDFYDEDDLDDEEDFDDEDDLDHKNEIKDEQATKVDESKKDENAVSSTDESNIDLKPQGAEALATKNEIPKKKTEKKKKKKKKKKS